jgi:cell division protein FtsB
VLDKIKNLQNHPYAKQLNDPRTWGLIIFAFIAIMVTWSGVKSVQTNYGLQRQISRLEQENDVKKLENSNLKLKNEYLKTDQFLELAARRQLGKAAEGEKILIVPKSVALAHTTKVSDNKAANQKDEQEANKPAYQKNFEAWINFFLHRGSSE